VTDRPLTFFPSFLRGEFVATDGSLTFVKLRRLLPLWRSVLDGGRETLDFSAGPRPSLLGFKSNSCFLLFFALSTNADNALSLWHAADFFPSSRPPRLHESIPVSKFHVAPLYILLVIAWGSFKLLLPPPSFSFEPRCLVASAALPWRWPILGRTSASI